MLSKIWEVPALRPLLPLVRSVYARPSSHVWTEFSHTRCGARRWCDEHNGRTVRRTSRRCGPARDGPHVGIIADAVGRLGVAIGSAHGACGLLGVMGGRTAHDSRAIPAVALTMQVSWREAGGALLRVQTTSLDNGTTAGNTMLLFRFRTPLSGERGFAPVVCRRPGSSAILRRPRFEQRVVRCTCWTRVQSVS